MYKNSFLFLVKGCP